MIGALLGFASVAQAGPKCVKCYIRKEWGPGTQDCKNGVSEDALPDGTDSSHTKMRDIKIEDCDGSCYMVHLYKNQAWIATKRDCLDDKLKSQVHVAYNWTPSHDLTCFNFYGNRGCAKICETDNCNAGSFGNEGGDN